MIEYLKPKILNKILLALGGLLCLFGIYMRFYHITNLDFIYYDEGYYMNFNRYFYDIVSTHFPNNFQDMFKALSLWVRLSLGTGKALWFMLADMRVFFGMYKAWYYPRILAALSGTFTLWLTYLFAKRFYGSRRVGFLSMVLLAILPGHVFYSRLAMQETFSTMCFFGGFYLYLFPRKLSYRTFLSAVCFAGAWFTNYRLITLPVHVAFCEIMLCMADKRLPDLRKYIWNILTFLCLIFFIGAIDEAQNTVLVFAWIFYQSTLAKEKFDFINFLSFPYYLFRLENFFYGLLFLSNIFLVIKKKWAKLLPFGLSCLHMLIYSFSAEKGARYLCVVIPFITMSVAWLIVYVFENYRMRAVRVGVCVVTFLLICGLLQKSVRVYHIQTDYRTAMEYLQKKDPNVKVVATQNYVLSLYTPRWQDAMAFPYQMRKFFKLYNQGYRYLVLGPQLYVSYVKGLKRFSPDLMGFLHFIIKAIPPIKVFDNFDDVTLERFVFDHNENLKRSIEFLRHSKENHYGELRIYDIRQIMLTLDRTIGIKNIKLNPDYKADRPYEKYGR